MQTDLGQTGTPQITTILTSFLISDDISLAKPFNPRQLLEHARTKFNGWERPHKKSIRAVRDHPCEIGSNEDTNRVYGM